MQSYAILCRLMQTYAFLCNLMRYANMLFHVKICQYMLFYAFYAFICLYIACPGQGFHRPCTAKWAKKTGPPFATGMLQKPL